MDPPSDAETPIKSEPVGVEVGAASSDPFAWAACSDKDVRSRVVYKQQAVEDALRHALKICQELRNPTGDENSAAPETSEARCGEEIEEWMREIDKLYETSQAFEVLIGVAGRTGAGKSTILNMLLEIPELLPSSNSEAATSCACRVSWNNDDTPGREFRAELVFRSREDVAQEIHQLFSMVQERQRLDDNEEDEGDEPFDRMEEEAERQSAILEGFKKIRAVWGLDEEAVEAMSPEELLSSNPEVLELLGTTKTIYSYEAERFAEDVKPYLDASENLQGFRAWPLITEVRLFVKAPFLKNGVVLVDLPGLSDAVESRAQVANKYAQKLEITAIVAPARRAIDEKTGVQLMSDYQTLRMQLDGRYHKKSFCVVVSQIDEIDCDVFIKGDPNAKNDPVLRKDTDEIASQTEKSAAFRAQLAREEKELAKAEERHAKARVKLDGLTPRGPGSQKMKKEKAFLDKTSKAREDKKKLKRAYDTQKKLVGRTQQTLAEIDRRLAMLRARQMWTCVWMRNRHIKKAIRRDFAQRQKALSREMRNRKEYDGSVDVVPVSATAFRDHLKGREPLGFPTVYHTGIPRLREWLVDSTLERREEHLDALLNALRRLFRIIQRWSLRDADGQALHIPRDIMEDLLFRTHTKFIAELGLELTRGSDRVKTLNPFKQIDRARKLCKRESCKAATRWAVKAPEDTASAAPMHWVTFNAILKRKGGPYYSKGREKREYNFPEAMAVAILRNVLEGWHKTFRVEIPSAEVPIMEGIEKVWEAFLDELRAQIQAIVPEMMPHFEESIQMIRGIKSEMRDKVHAALKRLSECSSEVHPEFLGSLRDQLAPMFEASLGFVGTGHFQQRRRYLYDRVKDESDDMFVAGYEKMQHKYTQNVAQLPEAFSEMVLFAGSKIKTQITLLLDGLEGPGGKDWAVADMQPSLQQRLQTAIMEWQMDWRFPKLEEGCFIREAVDIPREFIGEEQAVAVKQEPKSGESEGEEQMEE